MSNRTPESGQTIIAVTPTAALPCAEPEKTITIPLELWQRITRMLAQMRGQFAATERELSRLTLEKKS